jgi:hypothetical protein
MAKPTAQLSLLDQWAPPILEKQEINPVPIGFIATTFTFDADFFEEECLTRFLAMETEKQTDGPAYLIEREEKLAGLTGGLVLVDQHHCRGARSLRWDLVPCRIKGGVLHAKVTILRWSHSIRLIIGSANITPSGHCLQQEVFNVFDYFPGCDTGRLLILEALTFLRGIATTQCGPLSAGRFRTLADDIEATLDRWQITDQAYSKSDVAVRTMFVSPAGEDGFKKLQQLWDNHFSRQPLNATITSPFFDKNDQNHTPSRRIFELLRGRGTPTVHYHLAPGADEPGSNVVLVQAPEFLKNVPKPGIQEVKFSLVETLELPEGAKRTVVRPLHRKTLLLHNEDEFMVMAGSSNFSSPAFGLGKNINYEANVVYLFQPSRNRDAAKAMQGIIPPGKKLDLKQARFQPVENEDEAEDESKVLLLPAFFSEALCSRSGEHFRVQLFFNLREVAPEAFEVYLREKDKEPLFTYSAWLDEGKPASIGSDIPANWLPDQIFLRLPGNPVDACWPVIVEGQAVLPVPDQLRNLSLEALAFILSSHQPLHRLLAALERMSERGKLKDGENRPLDALQLVDTSGFLLQRTRKVFVAIQSLRSRLERPVYTLESLTWRLEGPIGVQSLVEAICREASLPGERRFLLVELVLELSRIKTTEVPYALKPKVVAKALQAMCGRIRKIIETDKSGDDPVIENYIVKALNLSVNAI